MAEIIVILIGLWLLGIIKIPWLTMPYFPVFSILGFQVTIQRLLIILIVIWLASTAGSPFRQMLWAFFMLWILSVVGVISVGSTLTLIVISVVVGLVLSVVQKGK